MNLQTANYLLNYRKSAGLSQEELAEKIGVSRQAVSKWERGEASPDTDNLIALAEVFNVTLDELIKGKAENEKCDNSDEKTDGKKTDKVNISLKDGIKVETNKGEKVDVSRNGVHVECSQIEVNVHDGDRSVCTKVPPSQVHINKHGVVVKDIEGNIISQHNFYNYKKVSMFYKFPFFAVAILAYLLFGIFNVCGGWAFGWIVLLTIPLYYSAVSAIINKNASHFAYPVLITCIYLYCGLFYSLWHPSWIMFLSIPLYYFLCEFIKKLIQHI